MTLSRSYLTVAETSAILAEELPSTDERRTAFDAAGSADKAVCCRQATRDIDACAYRGRVADADQEQLFPRIDHLGFDILPGGELDLPTGIAAWSRAGLPGAVRRAAAIQAARNAARALGFDRARAAADLAHAGVTSRSAAGAGTSVDAARATSAWANLDPDAARLLADLRARGAEAV